jgi:DNA replication protein DnaC
VTAGQVEAARLPIMLAELRLPTINRLWPEFAARADQEGWPAARFLASLVEHELAERVTRRVERHRLGSRLPPEKTLATFDFGAVPKVRKAHVLALAAGDSWLEKGANILVFGPPEPDSYCPSRYALRFSSRFDADRQTAAVAGGADRPAA